MQLRNNTRQQPPRNLTDVYAVCAVLYRVLTGTMPTSAISRMENDNLTAPTLLNPNIPRHVSNVIMHGLSLVSNDRIQTITDLVTQLFDDTADDHFQQQNTTIFQKPANATHLHNGTL